MSPTHCDTPGGTPPEAVELAVDDFPEVARGIQAARCAWRAGRIAQGQDHHATIFRGHQDVTVTKSIQHDPFQSGRGGRDRGKSLSRLGKSDLMGTRQVESERLRAFHQFAQVCIAPKQIFDELSSDGLFPSHSFTTSFGMTLGERRDCVIHDLQHRGGRRPYSVPVAFQDDRGQFAPHPPRGGQIQVDSLTGRNSLLCGAPALLSYRVDLGALRESPKRGRLGEHW
jgi:hypothetical protein